MNYYKFLIWFLWIKKLNIILLIYNRKLIIFLRYQYLFKELISFNKYYYIHLNRENNFLSYICLRDIIVCQPCHTTPFVMFDRMSCNLQCNAMKRKENFKKAIALLGGVQCLLQKYANKWLGPLMKLMQRM